jgi:DTW domain-containing protein YfiP
LSRAYCSACHYPVSTCLCEWVKPIYSPLNIIVLQHPLEKKHAKNTVKLLSLGLSNITVFEGERDTDFADIANRCLADPEKHAVCFPSEQSVSFEGHSIGGQVQASNRIEASVIFIDASWRKALKMWHLNPWLHLLPCWHFDSPPDNQYTIRKTSQKNSLSTLEAVVYVLETQCNLDCSPLINLFRHRQSYFKGT